MKKTVTLCLTLLLTACAGTSTRPVTMSTAAIDDERRIQEEIALKATFAMESRLRAVGNRVLVAAAPLCKDTNHTLGLYVANAYWFKAEQRHAAYAMGIDDHVRVTQVVPGSPAEAAGLLKGDIVLAMNGKAIGERENGPKDVASLSKALAGGDPATVTIKRGEEVRTITVQPAKRCAYTIALLNRTEVNAYANGKGIYVSRGMMAFVTDDELATVVGHELAHNVQGHIDAKTANSVLGGVLDTIAGVYRIPTQGLFGQMGANAFSKDMESEADYVGLYAIALAGYDIGKAPDFWRRMAALAPGAVNHSGSHPATPERFVAMKATVAEIQAKQSAGKTLAPEQRQ